MSARRSAPKYLDDSKSTSVTSISHTDSQRYRVAITQLERYSFWNGTKDVLPLWDSQKSAVALGVFYLNADYRLRNEGNVCEAALLKLPTGTGKSGIIATLTRCLHSVKKSLILTPRAALTEQLLQDIKRRFWKHIGFAAPDSGIWKADAGTAGAEIAAAYVEHFLPNAQCLRSILAQDEERVILVGTLQALDAVRRSRDDYKRKLERGGQLNDAEQEEFDLQSRVMAYLGTVDLVVVDEGHYEPAPSWSRSVRAIDRPTILLSATPFRNDYKFFRVRGRFVFNMPFQVAAKNRIIRSVEFLPTASAAPSIRTTRTGSRQVSDEVDDEMDDTLAVASLTSEQMGDISSFVRLLRARWPDVVKKAEPYTKSPKVIVRAAGYEVLCQLQDEIRAAFGPTDVLIHERVGKDAPERQYRTVASAQRHRQDATFWLHETKLLEGIDDPNIVAVAIFESFGNARQLVQQIGRAIRSTDRRRRRKQIATIIARHDLVDDVQRTWNRYLQFEDYCSANVENLVQSEAAMPERMLAYMPDLQYVEGDFRHKYLRNGEVRADDLWLPLRASIFLTDQHFDVKRAEEEIEEAIIAEDRFRPQEILDLPADAFGRVYYGWRNSPYLRHQYLSEWTLGICIGARIGKFLFVQDTGGIAFRTDEIDVRMADRSVLLKALPESTSKARTIITRMSAHSLDMSDRSIRTQSTRTRSFADTFTDLLDPSLVVTSAYGFVSRNGRYLGLARGRVSDASDTYSSLEEWLEWLRRLAAELESDGRVPNRVFDRYAVPVVVGGVAAEKPVSILLDLTTDAFSEFNVMGPPDGGSQLGHDLPFEDLCADINDEGEFDLVRQDGQKVSCKIEWRSETNSYRIKSPELNALYPPLAQSRSKRRKALTQHINREQAFRVLTRQEGVVYMRRGFYKTRDFVTPAGEVLPLEDCFAVPALRNATSEKGETFVGTSRWATESVFGMIKAICDGASTAQHGELAKELEHFGIMLLDDGGDELGDFFAIGDRRVAIIHAKAERELHDESVTALQAVGRQVMASLAFCSTQARVDGLRSGRWDRAYTANRTRLPLSRYFKNVGSLSSSRIDALVKSALQNPAWSREVWIVAGRLVNIDLARDNAKGNNLTNRRRQLLMYIDSMKTACARANTRLRLFGHGNA